MKPYQLSIGIAASLLLFGAASSSYAQQSTVSYAVSKPLSDAGAIRSVGVSRSSEYAVLQSRFEQNMHELEEVLTGNTHFTDLRPKLDAACEKLAAGTTYSCVATVTERPSQEKPHLLSRSLNLQMSFERRPVGGIVNIRVSLMPLFNGLGSANRPLASKNYSQAVDNLDPDALAGVIENLGEQTNEAFASRSN